MLYLPTPVTPEEAFQAIGRLRKDARDEIDRLIRFLDRTDGHMEREPEDEADEADAEPSLGSFDRMANQGKAWQQRSLWALPADDGEQDDADAEPSLGAIVRIPSAAGWDGPNPTGDQTEWTASNRDDREDEHDGREPDDTGIGDQDGMDEQVPFRDWQNVGIV